MATKPILFNTEMVQAILAGQKTVTRRAIKPQPKMQLSYISAGYGAGTWAYPPKAICNENGWAEEYGKLTVDDKCQNWTPPCRADDILYVRETWARISDWTDVDPAVGVPDGYIFKADWGDMESPRWRPSIHMPKLAARIFLRASRVCAERLQNIDEEDAKAEGVGTKDRFIEIWNRTLKQKDIGQYGWDANPWVWRIEFERSEKPKEG